MRGPNGDHSSGDGVVVPKCAKKEWLSTAASADGVAVSPGADGTPSVHGMLL